MHRREFLKLVAAASVGAAARLPFVAAVAAAGTKTVSYGGRLYRSDGTGKISVSRDAGSTWKLHSDLGRSYAVTKLAVDRRNRLGATVGFSGWAFRLVLAPDLKSWRTI
jgi:hypothetical protein